MDKIREKKERLGREERREHVEKKRKKIERLGRQRRHQKNLYKSEEFFPMHLYENMLLYTMGEKQGEGLM